MYVSVCVYMSIVKLRQWIHTQDTCSRACTCWQEHRLLVRQTAQLKCKAGRVHEGSAKLAVPMKAVQSWSCPWKAVQSWSCPWKAVQHQCHLLLCVLWLFNSVFMKAVPFTPSPFMDMAMSERLMPYIFLMCACCPWRRSAPMPYIPRVCVCCGCGYASIGIS